LFDLIHCIAQLAPSIQTNPPVLAQVRRERFVVPTGESPVLAKVIPAG